MSEQYYFSAYTYGVKARNKLEEAISDYLHSRQRELIPAEQMEVVQQQIIDTIAEYSKKAKRGAIITASFTDFGNEVWGDIVLRMLDDTAMPHAFCGFRFYKCKLMGETGTVEPKRKMPDAVTFDTRSSFEQEPPDLFNQQP